MTLPVDVVVPTIGRPSLGVLIDSLARQEGPFPRSVVVVDDRPDASSPLTGVPAPPTSLPFRLEVVCSGGRGPAAARNMGWRSCGSEWVEFVDDDVVLPPGWSDALALDLFGPDGDGPPLGGSQGRITVPLPHGRRATDWERNVAGLERARWATADMAYRRDVLELVGGFDERFPRAFREDADLALRVIDAGARLAAGHRWVLHPVRPAGRWVSVRLQRGNRDDALMGALHGPGWRQRSGAPRGAIGRHAVVTGMAAAASVSALAGRPRSAAVGLAGWGVGTSAFAVERIAPGPRDRRELSVMLATSLLIPPVAVWHRLAGEVRWSGVRWSKVRLWVRLATAETSGGRAGRRVRIGPSSMRRRLRLAVARSGEALLGRGGPSGALGTPAGGRGVGAEGAQPTVGLGGRSSESGGTLTGVPRYGGGAGK